MSIRSLIIQLLVFALSWQAQAVKANDNIHYNHVLELLNDSIKKRIEINDAQVELNCSKNNYQLQAIEEKYDQINTIEFPGFNVNNTILKAVFIFNDNESQTLTCDIAIYKNIPVSSRTIQKNQTIVPEDIKNVKLPMRLANETFVTNPKQIIGMISKVKIPNGLPIKEFYIKKPVVIKSNDVIDIIYTNKNITVKTRGFALENGSIGDTIKVKSNKDTILKAIILDKNTVSINKS